MRMAQVFTTTTPDISNVDKQEMCRQWCRHSCRHLLFFFGYFVLFCCVNERTTKFLTVVTPIGFRNSAQSTATRCTWHGRRLVTPSKTPQQGTRKQCLITYKKPLHENEKRTRRDNDLLFANNATRNQTWINPESIPICSWIGCQ